MDENLVAWKDFNIAVKFDMRMQMVKAMFDFDGTWCVERPAHFSSSANEARLVGPNELSSIIRPVKVSVSDN